jgi:nitrite reductase/ring-hydroxylating ferredoxin subunit
MAVATLVPLAKAHDVQRERLTRIVIDGQALAIIRTRDRFLAFPDACPHRGRQLSAHGGSATEDGVVECLFHACRFDAACGGAPVAGPCSDSLRVITLFEVEGVLLAHADELAALAPSPLVPAYA